MLLLSCCISPSKAFARSGVVPGAFSSASFALRLLFLASRLADPSV